MILISFGTLAPMSVSDGWTDSNTPATSLVIGSYLEGGRGAPGRVSHSRGIFGGGTDGRAALEQPGLDPLERGRPGFNATPVELRPNAQLCVAGNGHISG